MAKLDQWVQQFHRDGFLVIPKALPKAMCGPLIGEYNTRVRKDSRKRRIQKRMFEDSPLNLQIFENQPVLAFAQKLIGNTIDGGYKDDDPYSGDFGGSANAVHVFHNNSFVVRAGSDGLAKNGWHQDDTPHIFSTGDPLPDHIRLNVLAFTVIYYLTDVKEVANGPTQVIPGSHRFGKPCLGDVSEYEHKIHSCLGEAGTAVCFNNQVWHRGSRNNSTQDRFITQVSYGKRLVGHKYGDFMNYQMPKHCYENASPQLKRLLGFLPHGAYG